MARNDSGGGSGGAKGSGQRNKWSVGSGARGKKTWHIYRQKWLNGKPPPAGRSYGGESALSKNGKQLRAFATQAAAQRAADKLNSQT